MKPSRIVAFLLLGAMVWAAAKGDWHSVSYLGLALIVIVLLVLLRSASEPPDCSPGFRRANRSRARGFPVLVDNRLAPNQPDPMTPQSHSPPYRIRLMFEWGGGSLWSGNPATLDRFGVGPIEDKLPISDPTRQRLRDLTAWHDGALDWNYPPDPSPWTAEECAAFERAAGAMLERVRAELGVEYEVVYQRL